ncbi:hypothetical protein PRK78_002944 [Emydomyces testavorans]|uniref:Uncharacterized protein n=1 Tax=Emydomyces testavorans TaxID=2070801 RepID=A0AAF0II20_9EURO|nr:hypothetical protein PRK78_002944 [Emydomyces testavorans]
MSGQKFSEQYPSPLEGYQNLPPLPNTVYGILTSDFGFSEKNDDGKSLRNPQTGVRSSAYETFQAPLTSGRRGAFDVHIYHFQVRL